MKNVIAYKQLALFLSVVINIRFSQSLYSGQSLLAKPADRNFIGNVIEVIDKAEEISINFLLGGRMMKHENYK